MPGTEMTETEFSNFRMLIYAISGIKVLDSKSLLMTNRVRRRLKATGISSFSDYLALLKSPAGAVEMPAFLSEITTNETYFYRDVHHFNWLGETFFPEIAKAGRLGSRPKRLRIWSAAASTGEELYGIAMKIQPFKSQFQGWSLEFLGTDLSKAALDSASLGVYDERSLRSVPPVERTRNFEYDPKSQRWTIRDELRKGIRWKMHNLMQPLHEEPFDCIFIKNVLIYFDNASKQVVTKHLLNQLASGGSLVVGPTEGIFTMLGPLVKHSAWLYQKP